MWDELGWTGALTISCGGRATKLWYSLVFVKAASRLIKNKYIKTGASSPSLLTVRSIVCGEQNMGLILDAAKRVRHNLVLPSVDLALLKEGHIAVLMHFFKAQKDQVQLHLGRMVIVAHREGWCPMSFDRCEQNFTCGQRANNDRKELSGNFGRPHLHVSLLLILA